MAKKVLIIDDSKTEVACIQNSLENAGFKCIVSTSPLEVYESVYENAPDLIISDVLMPTLSGFELCRILKSDDLTKKIPIILYSELEKNIDMFWAYRAGADLFAKKSDGLEKLIKSAKDTIEKFPISEEYKYRLQASTPQIPDKNAGKMLSKEVILNEFNNFKEKYCTSIETIAKFFRLISKFVNYDVLMLALSDENGKKDLFFDFGDTNVSENAIEEIKTICNFKEKIDKTHTIVKNDPKTNISSLSDFALRLEFETNINSKARGFVCFYAKENPPSYELRLIKTIKTKIEEVMKCYLLKNKSLEQSNKTVRKIYSKVDLMRLLEHEISWHKTNNFSLGLALIEVADLDKYRKIGGEQFFDTLLAKASNIIASELEPQDFLYRDEDNVFLIVMTASVEERIRASLERIKTKMEDPCWLSYGNARALTAKVCALVFKDECKNAYEFLDDAYEILYGAKFENNSVIIK